VISHELGAFRERRKSPENQISDVFQSCSPAEAKNAAFDFTEVGVFRRQLCDQTSLIAQPRVAA
jgi:hypothetical protein